MISRHIKRSPENDSYRNLANYIADARHDGGKTLLAWCSGCWSGGDEYELAISEVEATQALNTRSIGTKAYHLIVSFRPEDEARLSPEIFKTIELEFAKALGFEEHQRHAGVHKNTDNIHLHVAYNKIHPERYTCRTPYFDYPVRDKVCRELERKYGLSVDNGPDPNVEKPLNDAALAYEAHTGQESFLSYTQRHKPDILAALGKAPDWAACHQALIKFGLTIKPHGNGLIIQSHDDQHSIKASSLDRSISKARLEKRFGHFRSLEPSVMQTVKPAREYNSAPLHKDPDRDGLHKQFQAGLQKRKAELAKLNDQDKRLYGSKIKEWEGKYQAIRRLPMDRKRRREVMQSYKDKRRKDFTALRQVMKAKKDEVKEHFPYANWSQFLRHESQRGNETALAVLRSKKDKALPERPQAQGQPKPHVSVVFKIAEIFKAAGVKGVSYRIDKKGTVIFTLPNGDSIRDNGKEIHFSNRHDQTKLLAEKLAQAKWGHDVHLDGSVLKRKPITYPPIQRAPDKGLGR
jgi:hypothetical protein